MIPRPFDEDKKMTVLLYRHRRFMLSDEEDQILRLRLGIGIDTKPARTPMLDRQIADFVGIPVSIVSETLKATIQKLLKLGMEPVDGTG